MTPNADLLMLEANDPVRAPRNREVAVSVAYLRLQGATQAEAAGATNVDPRTVVRWESCSWWPEVQREASARWLEGLAAAARRGLGAAVSENGALALRVLERLEPALAPPRKGPGEALEPRKRQTWQIGDRIIEF